MSIDRWQLALTDIPLVDQNGIPCLWKPLATANTTKATIARPKSPIAT